jgi:hypothetical protein
LSELIWTTATPHPEAAAFWAAEYPAMTDAAVVRAVFAAAGYRVIGEFEVSRAGWEAYYGPLEARCAALEGELAGDPAPAETRAEIALWRAHGADFGYGFFIAEAA